MFEWAKSLPVQQYTLSLWRWLAHIAMILGILPIRGWPLHPRPLTLPVAWMFTLTFGAFLAVSLLLRVGLDYNTSRKHTETNKMITLIWVTCTGISSVTAIQQRHRLTLLVHCIKVYSQRHPLSSHRWWFLLLLTVARLEVWVIVAVTDLSMPGTLRSPNMLEGVMVAVFVSVLWPLLSCLLYLVVVCPVATIGALAADLREECVEGLRCASNGSVRQQRKKVCRDALWAERWRGLHVRQRMLHDLALQANSLHGVHVIFILICESFMTSISLSHALGSFAAGSRRTASLAAAMGFTGFFILALNTLCHQWAASEVTTLCRALQGYAVVCGGGSSPLAEKEIAGWIRDIEAQEGRCNIFGLFYLDGDFTTGLIAGIVSYLVVCFQFNIGPI